MGKVKRRPREQSADTEGLFRADTPPIDLEQGRDAFGHKAYAVAISSALLEAQAPFTFGLFGALRAREEHRHRRGAAANPGSSRFRHVRCLALRGRPSPS